MTYNRNKIDYSKSSSQEHSFDKKESGNKRIKDVERKQV